MFKHLGVAVLIAFMAVVPANATCVGCWCEDIVNDNFNGTGGWTYSGATPTTITVPCGSGGTTKAVQMGGNNTVTQTFNVPANVQNWFTINFDVISPTLNGSWWDQITITVTNNTTSQVETFYVHGNQLSFNCEYIGITLANDYDGDNVTIEFLGSWLTATTWYLDNAQFWYNVC